MLFWLASALVCVCAIYATDQLSRRRPPPPIPFAPGRARSTSRATRALSPALYNRGLKADKDRQNWDAAMLLCMLLLLITKPPLLARFWHVFV